MCAVSLRAGRYVFRRICHPTATVPSRGVTELLDARATTGEWHVALAPNHGFVAIVKDTSVAFRAASDNFRGGNEVECALPVGSLAASAGDGATTDSASMSAALRVCCWDGHSALFAVAVVDGRVVVMTRLGDVLAVVDADVWAEARVPPPTGDAPIVGLAFHTVGAAAHLLVAGSDGLVRRCALAPIDGGARVSVRAIGEATFAVVPHHHTYVTAIAYTTVARPAAGVDGTALGVAAGASIAVLAVAGGIRGAANTGVPPDRQYAMSTWIVLDESPFYAPFTPPQPVAHTPHPQGLPHAHGGPHATAHLYTALAHAVAADAAPRRRAIAGVGVPSASGLLSLVGLVNPVRAARAIGSVASGALQAAGVYQPVRPAVVQLLFSPTGDFLAVLGMSAVHVVVVSTGEVVMVTHGDELLALPPATGPAALRSPTERTRSGGFGDGAGDAVNGVADDADGGGAGSVAGGGDNSFVGVEWWSHNALLFVHRTGRVSVKRVPRDYEVEEWTRHHTTGHGDLLGPNPEVFRVPTKVRGPLTACCHAIAALTPVCIRHRSLLQATTKWHWCWSVLGSASSAQLVGPSWLTTVMLATAALAASAERSASCPCPAPRRSSCSRVRSSWGSSRRRCVWLLPTTSTPTRCTRHGGRTAVDLPATQ